MDKTKVKVVIPIYTQTLTGRHLHSFQNNIKVFAAYPIVLLAPEGLDIEAITSLAPQAEVMRVSKDWLGEKGIAGYNNMMLSKSFYQLFADCEYILICQTDVWVFCDELSQWCDKGYDYVGAPWPKRRIYSMPIISQFLWLRRKLFKREGKLMRQDYFNKVGNGGFSLRKISALLEACDRYEKTIAEFKRGKGTLCNEDWFWSLIPNHFRYPSFDEALGFSFDVHPDISYK